MKRVGFVDTLRGGKSRPGMPSVAAAAAAVVVIVAATAAAAVIAAEAEEQDDQDDDPEGAIVTTVAKHNVPFLRALLLSFAAPRKRRTEGFLGCSGRVGFPHRSCHLMQAPTGLLHALGLKITGHAGAKEVSYG